VIDLEVIEDPAAAVVALDPIRSDILAALAEPGSATTVAGAIGLARQKVNYHLRLLEEHGLAGLVEERPRRGLTERVLQATARSYVVSPAALGAAAPDPGRADRLSSRYLVALAARIVREVADLARRADEAGKPLATLAIDTDVRFATAADRAAFTAELAAMLTELTSRYHDAHAAGGRWHRLVVAAHPRPARDHNEHGGAPA
jgi:DNA-binding transcriptional ArsR family regulator